MDRAFVDDCIKSMNEFRRIHQVSPLTHNSVVSTIAQRWADHMTCTGSLAHNPNASYNGQPLGENCAFKWHSDKRNITGRETDSNVRHRQHCRQYWIWVIPRGEARSIIVGGGL